MIQGRMAKFLKEVCLVEQPLVTDAEGRSVKDCVGLGKELGADVTLKVTFACSWAMASKERRELC